MPGSPHGVLLLTVPEGRFYYSHAISLLSFVEKGRQRPSSEWAVDTPLEALQKAIRESGGKVHGLKQVLLVAY